MFALLCGQHGSHVTELIYIQFIKKNIIKLHLSVPCTEFALFCGQHDSHVINDLHPIFQKSIINALQELSVISVQILVWASTGKKFAWENLF